MPHGLVEERSVWCPVDLVSHHAERSHGALACALDSYCACPVYSQSRYTFGNRTFSSESSGPSDLHEGGLVSVQEICCEHLYLLLRSKLLMNSFHISILYRVQLHLWSTHRADDGNRQENPPEYYHNVCGDSDGLYRRLFLDVSGIGIYICWYKWEKTRISSYFPSLVCLS